MHHFSESTGGVGAVLPGKTTVLFVDELQLGQALLNLTLECLGLKRHTHTHTHRHTHMYMKVLNVTHVYALFHLQY